MPAKPESEERRCWPRNQQGERHPISGVTARIICALAGERTGPFGSADVMEPCDRESLSDYQAAPSASYDCGGYGCGHQPCICQPLPRATGALSVQAAMAQLNPWPGAVKRGALAIYSGDLKVWENPDGSRADAAAIREAARMHFMPSRTHSEDTNATEPFASIDTAGGYSWQAPTMMAMAEPQTITRAAEDVKTIAARLKEIEAEKAEARRMRDPDAATGAFLDRLGDENGLKRSECESDYTFRQRVKKAIAGEPATAPTYDGSY